MSPSSGPTGPAPRIGLFGQLGSSNIGNDGSLDAVLAHLRVEHPTAVVDFFCTGHERVARRYGLPATALHWFPSYDRRPSGIAAVPLKVLGKILDTIRTLSWVRRHDVVIVPGMGVLEATLPLQPWGFPYALFLLCAAGRFTGTPVALLDVGAEVIARPATRLLITWAARLAAHRSFRDSHSKNAISRMGVDVSGDDVVADLVLSLPTPPAGRPEAGVVGVGVMSWYGSDADRSCASAIHAAYVTVMKGFVRWLVDSGRRVRLFIGDDVDDEVVREILTDVRAHRRHLDPGQVIAGGVHTLDDLIRQMAPCESVVVTRYHNLLTAMRLGKATISMSYAPKGDALMAEMGMAEFCHSAHTPDLERLIAQFTILESRRGELERTVSERTAEASERLRNQLMFLSATLFTTESRSPISAQRPSDNGRIR